MGLAVTDALSHRDRQYSRSCGSLHSLTAAVGVSVGVTVGGAVGVEMGAVVDVAVGVAMGAVVGVAVGVEEGAAK